MFLLDNTVRDYAWGAVDGLARLVGTDPTGGPEAELWVGAHPGAPSRLADGRSLADVVAADPAGVLGPEVISRFGSRLPFLLKVLAIGAPLSIQLHPSPEQAREGWDREEAAGVPLDAPHRTYRDPFAKPEVLVALEPTDVLVGFRPGGDAAAALRAVGDPATDALAEMVDGEPDARLALGRLLDAEGDERDRLAEAAEGQDGTAAARTWVRRLATAYPGDPTTLAPLVMERHRLAPGEGVFLPAGVPHAYLEGAGVELMAASDNVVRGGLTPKHVDRAELARLLAPPGVGVQFLPGEDEAAGIRAYLPPVPDIALRRIDVDGPVAAPREGPGPALILSTSGEVRVVVGEVDAGTLGAGRAVLVLPTEREGCRLEGRGTAWWATVASPAW